MICAPVGRRLARRQLRADWLPGRCWARARPGPRAAGTLTGSGPPRGAPRPTMAPGAPRERGPPAGPSVRASGPIQFNALGMQISCGQSINQFYETTDSDGCRRPAGRLTGRPAGETLDGSRVAQVGSRRASRRRLICLAGRPAHCRPAHAHSHSHSPGPRPAASVIERARALAEIDNLNRHSSGKMALHFVVGTHAHARTKLLHYGRTKIRK